MTDHESDVCTCPLCNQPVGVTPTVGSPVATPNVRFHEDLRTLLDHMDGEYVSPTLTLVLRRLRAVVGQ